jgi:Ca2+-binding RTX toxin-like protein
MPISSSPDFIVNTTAASNQLSPGVTALPDGRFIATWQTLEGGQLDVRARVFNASGTATGQDSVVNSTVTGDQYLPVVASFGDGNLVFAWTSNEGSQFDIRARIYNPEGNPVGPDFLVNSTTTNTQYGATIAQLADGRFVIAWESNDGTQTDINLKLFNADGTPSTSDLLVNSTVSGGQEGPSIAALQGGGFALVWETDEGGLRDIRARVFQNDGTALGPDFIVNSTTFDTQLRPSAAALAGGGFVVAWDSSDGTSNQDIRARIFDAKGSPKAPDFLVNSTVAGGQYSPAIAALPDGRFYITWDSFEAVQADIRARLFNADGTASAADFIVNSIVANNQFSPVTALLADGRLVTSWDSLEGGQTDIRVAFLDPNVFEGTTATDSWTGEASNEKMFGYAGDDTFLGGAGDDYLNGGDNADNLKGGRGNDTLDGGSGVDELTGNAGDDRLIGGRGSDSLKGGKGNDQFIYLSSADGSDSITKFATGDKLVFDNAGFAGQKKIGPLKAKFFVSGTSNQALDANDHFIFRTSDDTIWYDADGKGGAASVLIADFTNNFDLKAPDILVV